jgi:hypothetical protein
MTTARQRSTKSGKIKRKRRKKMETVTARVDKCCGVCKFANFDVGNDSDDSKNLICTVNPLSPEVRESDDVCLKFEPKYKDLKILISEDHLEEYDPAASSQDKRYSGINIPTTKEIGEDEWQN